MDNNVIPIRRVKAPFPSAVPFTAPELDQDIDVADVKVTRMDGQTFVLIGVRYEATAVEGDWLTFETYSDVYRVDRELVAYWEVL